MNQTTAVTFRLYVAGDAQNSVQAITNLRAICDAYLANQHNIEIVDVLRHPDRALLDGIFMTPTLVKVSPLPQRRIVGTLSQKQPVLDAVGIASLAA
jgi:circadian clock protein KaiB